jgi:hypothetical protein
MEKNIMTMAKLTIEVHRKHYKEEYTIGSLYIGGHWVCNTLEPHCIDWENETKVSGKTAIPEGCYTVEMGFSTKFKRLVPYLKDVPHFTGIMIHPGNSVINTRGCILVGFNTMRGYLTQSKVAFEKIIEKIRYAERTGNGIEVVIH